LQDLQQESLAADLIAAEHDLGKEHGAQIRDLLVHMGPAAFEPIVNALETESDRNARMFLLGILQESGMRVADLIRGKLQHPDWHMVRNMINLLIKLQPKDLIDSLEMTVEHPEPKVRKEVVKALTSTQGARAVPLLAKLIHDPDESVRHQAIINLGQFKMVDSAAPLLIEALRPKECFDGDVQAEELAIRSLGSLKAPQAAEVLEKYVTNVHFYQRPDEDLVALAAKCLTTLGDGAGLAVLEKGAKSWNATIKRICKKSLADARAREGN
jgi:HEAT repeat protein